MPDEQPSPKAMRVAEEWFKSNLDAAKELGVGDTATFEDSIQRLATIIDREMEPKWIKCSERMPTEKDGNSQGKVLWCCAKPRRYGFVGPWDDSFTPGYWTHWLYQPDDPEPEDEVT